MKKFMLSITEIDLGVTCGSALLSCLTEPMVCRDGEELDSSVNKSVLCTVRNLRIGYPYKVLDVDTTG